MAFGSRGPASSRVYGAFERKLAGEWPPGLTTFTGDEMYYLDRAQHLLLDALLPKDEAPDFTLSVYGEEKVNVSTVIQAARSVGMFSPRRVVLVRDVGMLDGDAESLAHYAKHPPRDSYLLVRAPVLDRRRKLHKALLGAGQVLKFEAVKGFNPSRWSSDVTAIAKEKSVRLDNRATALLAQLCAGDLYRVASELEKIQAWLGSGTASAVNAATVQQVASSGGTMSGWAVADAVMRRDEEGALEAARGLVEGGDEPIRIVGGLAYRSRLMIKAAAMLAAGTPLPAILKDKRFGAARESLREGLEAYSLGELRSFPALLLAADRTLKSRSLNPRSVLEHLVQEMTAPGAEAAEVW